jgi:cell division protein FtsB
MRKKGFGWVWWMGVILGIVVAARTGGNISRLLKIQGMVGQNKQDLMTAEAENVELKQKLVEVQTPEFIEREAREKLGLGREGERVIVLPDNQEQPSFAKASEGKIPNWILWRKLYLGF